MNRVLILVNITGLIIGISYGLHGPILPVFAKNIIGATYSELGNNRINKFCSLHVHSTFCRNFT